MLRNNKRVSIVLVGLGGYGIHYYKTLLREFAPGEIKLSGIVDPYIQESKEVGKILDKNIPFFDSLEEFYIQTEKTDLAIISSPIHCHVPQSCSALNHDSHVLCEKPLGVTVQEAKELIRKKSSTGKWVKIGYQWSFSKAIQSLKKDIKAGRFGKPVKFKALCFWPREFNYYSRNDWAGKKKDPKGIWILDSPANNAMAHFIHNMLFVLGDDISTSTLPRNVVAELYKGYPIENFDTVACRFFTEGDVECLFYGSHCTATEVGPLFNYKFEEAEISFGEVSQEISVNYSKGKQEKYDSPDKDHHFTKLFNAIHSVSNPHPVICGPEAAYAQTLCMNGIQDSLIEISPFPRTLIHRDGDRLWIKGLDRILLECYHKGWLPSEANIFWATIGKSIDLENYHSFPKQEHIEKHG
jgi:predicted dehydrogenase